MTSLHTITAALLKPTLRFMSGNRLPQRRGRLRLPGLHGEVTVHRDKWGIPHLHAGNRHDLYFAQGVVHAQDRLWQMELNRRAATGRLAELVGPVALDTDRLARTLGFARLAVGTWDRLGEEVKGDVEAYTAGINAYLESDPPLPVAFTLLRTRPGPWQVTDTVAFGRLQAWALCSGWHGELIRAQLAQAIGPDLAEELEPRYPDRNPITLPDGIEFNTFTVDGMLQAAAGPFLGKGALDGGGRGSNAWVISAERSATGRAILCNDMHLPTSTPGLWYLSHQRADTHSQYPLHVAGATQPGLPYVLVGHNAHIAWGATLAFTDVEDLFVEKLDEDRRQYRFKEEWRPLEIVEERIAVKGQADHVEEVRLSYHGPLISNVVESNGLVLALNSMTLRPDTGFEGFAALNQARGWDDFVDACRRIETPALNLVYADTDGNIGYWVTGRVPVRARGQGLTPAPGWTGEYEWVGEVPFTEMPHAFNPARGYLITCNHRIVPDGYPHWLGANWMNGYRARRLEELFAERDTISPADCRRFHFDVVSIPGRELQQRLADFQTDDPDAQISLDLLRQWDARLDPDSAGGAVYKVLLTRLAHVLLGQTLGEDLANTVLGLGVDPVLSPGNEFYGHWAVTVQRLLEDPDSGWIPGEIGREAILTRCLAETTAELRQRLGDNPGQWAWGRLHRVSFPHALGAQPPLDRVFDQGPFPIGGDTNTVMQTATRPGDPYDNNNFSPTFRQIVPMGDLGRVQTIAPPGQSGQVGSPHYGDLIRPWLEGGYCEPAWEEAEVNVPGRDVLILVPNPV